MAQWIPEAGPEAFVAHALAMVAFDRDGVPALAAGVRCRSS